MTGYVQKGVVFESAGNRLVGIATIPEQNSSLAVLILVGGPQYRVGSHRQYTLLARHLAKANIGSLRFDFTGTGDSEGEQRPFFETGTDISAAVDAMTSMFAADTRIAIWGLCDGASAALLYAHRDARIESLVLLNPWVSDGIDYSPEVKLTHYYAPLFRGSDSWRRLLTGNIRIKPVLKDISAAVGARLRKTFGLLKPGRGQGSSFVVAMMDGLDRFSGRSLILLSGQDMTAQEFVQLVKTDAEWNKLVSADRISVHHMPEADHTFSKSSWEEEMQALTRDWLLDQKVVTDG